MTSPVRSVPLEHILPDQSLRYRDPLALWSGAEALRRSVRRHGVLRPVRLRETEGGLQAAAGYRRLEAAAELGLAEVPAEVVDHEPGALLVRAAEEHAGQPANVRELTRAVKIALALGWDDHRVAQELLPALGLEPSVRLVQRHARLRALPPIMLDLLVAKAYSLRRCLPFCDLATDECELLAAVATGLGLGARQIEETASRLREVAAREGLPLGRVVGELELDRPDQASGEALSRLERRRYPDASKRRQVVDELARQLTAQGVGVGYDRNFARDGVDLRLRVESVEQLRRLADELGSGRVVDLVRRILEQL